MDVYYCIAPFDSIDGPSRIPLIRISATSQTNLPFLDFVYDNREMRLCSGSGGDGYGGGGDVGGGYGGGGARRRRCWWWWRWWRCQVVVLAIAMVVVAAAVVDAVAPVMIRTCKTPPRCEAM